ncbi:MAG: stage V sporulation protein AC [Oscillospiraceae bacterium]|nr:stage V sporulation protein AC [Oscillospiraceae bacterium]
MNMSNEEYKQYAEQHMPRSKAGRNMLRAFLVGGAICAAGQGLIALYTWLGLDEEGAATACSVTLVMLGALLTGLGVYDDIARFAGAGTLVPITGFANSVVSPALEYKTEGRIAGTAAKMFLIAGPVIVFGMTAGALYGLVLLLFSLA